MTNGQDFVEQTYRECSLQGVSPIGLVVALYERAIADLRQTIAAMRKRDFEAAAGTIHHTFLILQQLQGTLDFESGGETARQLERFYNVIRGKLLQAQIRSSSPLMEELIRALGQVRDSWALVQEQMSSRLPSTHPDDKPVSVSSPDETSMEEQWNA